jgi:ABC-type tungstate transport system substrate-binding protein
MSNLPVAAIAPIVVIAVAFVVYCVVDIVRQPETRYLPKAVWALISIVSIPLGGILYLLLGRSFRPVDAGRS